MGWLKYALKRLLMLIPVILSVTFILFVILSLAPGDVARLVLGQDATPEQVAQLNHEMGLDKRFRSIAGVRPQITIYSSSVGSGTSICNRNRNSIGNCICNKAVQPFGLRLHVRCHAALLHARLLVGDHVPNTFLPNPALAAGFGHTYLEVLHTAAYDPWCKHACIHDKNEPYKHA